MENGQYVNGSLWFYAPTKVVPPIFAFLFLVSGFTHAYQCIHYKCWKVTGIFPWASTIFTAGYILREIGAFDYTNRPIFISSIVMVYAAPPLYELANYLVLSRILYYVPYHSPIHPGRVLTTFGAISAVVESLTGQGAARSSNSRLTQAQQNVGHSLLKAALILQLCVLASFVSLAAYFHNKCKKASILPENLKAALITLYCSSALIGTRTIYRTVEYFVSANIHPDQVTNPETLPLILRYEWFFWVFEGTLMIVNTYLLNVRHPMRFLPRNNKIYLAEDGTTEIEGQGYDNRPWYITLFDPFDIVGLVQGINTNRRFWETQEAGRMVAPTAMSPSADVEKGKAVATQETPSRSN